MGCTVEWEVSAPSKYGLVIAPTSDRIEEEISQIFSKFSEKFFIAIARLMAFFRQYVAPLLVVLVFLISLIAVSARIFLPNDMAAPAPIEEVSDNAQASDTVADLPPALSALIRGLPDELGLSEQL